MSLLTQKDIREFQDIGSRLPQVDYPVLHHHSDHTYVREFFMPAKHFVVGKEHKTRHLNILARGRCVVWTVHGRHNLNADNGPVIFESMAGVKKVVYAKTDIIWLTVHATDETDQDLLEGEIIQAAEQFDLFPELDSIPLIKSPQGALELK